MFNVGIGHFINGRGSGGAWTFAAGGITD